MILAAGFNGTSQLGDISDTFKPSPLKVSVDGIVCLASGEDHTVIIYNDGAGIALGDDEDYAIGTNERTVYREPVKLDIEGEPLAYAACGTYYSCYLTKGGDLIMCSMFCKNKRVRTHMDKKFIYVTGNERSICAINEDGVVFCFDQNPEEPPKSHSFDFPICDITKGQTFIIAVDVNGNAYGNGFLNNWNDEFVKITSIERVSRVFGNYNHVIAIDAEGKAYVSGSGYVGQLGIDHALLHGEEEEVLEFQEVTSLSNKKIICAGGGQLHSLFLSDNGTLFSCGHNQDGQLLTGRANGDSNGSEFPTEVTIDGHVTHVVCGQLQSFVFVGLKGPEHPGLKHFGK